MSKVFESYEFKEQGSKKSVEIVSGGAKYSVVFDKNSKTLSFGSDNRSESGENEDFPNVFSLVGLRGDFGEVRCFRFQHLGDIGKLDFSNYVLPDSFFLENEENREKKSSLDVEDFEESEHLRIQSIQFHKNNFNKHFGRVGYSRFRKYGSKNNDNDRYKADFDIFDNSDTEDFTDFFVKLIFEGTFPAEISGIEKKRIYLGFEDTEDFRFFSHIFSFLKNNLIEMIDFGDTRVSYRNLLLLEKMIKALNKKFGKSFPEIIHASHYKTVVMKKGSYTYENYHENSDGRIENSILEIDKDFFNIIIIVKPVPDIISDCFKDLSLNDLDEIDWSVRYPTFKKEDCIFMKDGSCKKIDFLIACYNEKFPKIYDCNSDDGTDDESFKFDNDSDDFDDEFKEFKEFKDLTDEFEI